MVVLYLTDEEEDFLTGCASISFTRSQLQVIVLAQEVVTQKGMEVVVTKGWWAPLHINSPKYSVVHGMTVANDVGGLKTTAIYPFNPSALTSANQKLSLAERTGLR